MAYKPRALTYEPLQVGVDDDAIVAVGLAPSWLLESVGPTAVVVRCIETNLAHPVTPVLNNMAEFDLRFEEIVEE